MRRDARNLAFVVFWLALALAVACNESEFGGKSATGNDPKGGKTDDACPEDPEKGVTCAPGSSPGSPGQGPRPGTPPEIQGCVQGDKIDLVYPEKIQSCIDKGNLFAFDSDQCMSMTPASFTCDFDTLMAEIKERKPDSPLINSLKERKDKGAFMVGCGQANGGDIIVGQVWLPPAQGTADCKFTAGVTNIHTICFDGTNTLSLPYNPTEDQVTDFVLKCMNFGK